jgi:hypothetical protein
MMIVLSQVAKLLFQQPATGHILWMNSQRAPTAHPAWMASSALIYPSMKHRFVDFGGQAIDLAALLAGNEGLAVTYTNPANNVYQASFSEDGGTFFYELSVISESEITGFMEIGFDADGISCTMTMDFSVTLSE